MSTTTQELSNVSAKHEGSLNPPAVSRRGFLEGVGGLAALMATGAAVLEPSINPASQAEAIEIGPLVGDPRLKKAAELRLELAKKMVLDGIPSRHPSNRDEELYYTLIGNYSKGLPHNDIGEVNRTAYIAMAEALLSGQPDRFEQIPLGGTRKLTNPQAGLAFDTEGDDPHQLRMPNAPELASAEEAAEAVELYWMALLRDVSFTDYPGHPLVAQACQELSSLPAFAGPRIGNQVTPQTLFRDTVAGGLQGPYISQFMLKDTPFGAEYVERKMRTLLPGNDHLTDFAEWLAAQRGGPVAGAEHFDNTRRYVRNGRDLGQWVHLDVLFQAYFNACLILIAPQHPEPHVGGIGAPLNPGNPYLQYNKQYPFGTWGPPFIKALMCEVATRALKAVWFHKWFVHRRLRPEAFGGRIHVLKNGWNTTPYPIHPSVLDSQALDLSSDLHGGSYLLPMTFPEGSPTHPAYGAGHATVAGACVTILKALFDESFPVPGPVVPSGDGLALESYSGPDLTVGGELNKLASNVATGRNHAGVHWRTDGINSLLLGEQVAIKVLRDHKKLLNEPGSFIFTGFLGNSIVI